MVITSIYSMALAMLLQHADSTSGPQTSGIRELLKDLQSNDTTCPIYLNFHNPLACIQSNPVQSSCIPLHHPVELHTRSPIQLRKILSMNFGKPTSSLSLSSMIFLFPHVPTSTATNNAPSFILDEALVMLGQPWSLTRKSFYSPLYLVSF